MEFVRPIGGERDVDALQRVQRMKDQQREQREQQRRKGSQGADRRSQEGASEAVPEGPIEGDDGHLHIDIRA